MNHLQAGITLSSVDFKLYGLGQAYLLLGRKALEAIMLGLSRKVQTTQEDVKLLISQWERRDLACCFDGTPEDLVRMTDTYVLALSYKHQHKSTWTRKGKNLVSKMSDSDQEILTTVVSALRRIPTLDYVIVWCDQIISTKLADNENNSLGWYNAGLLPYAALPVLKLTPEVPECVLERRIWIKAERSLGRMGVGTLDADYASSGSIASFGESQDIRTILMNLAQLILSGYWPEDTGFWANDYQDMKMWAVYVACKGPKRLPHEGLPIFEQVKAVDNLAIISCMSQLGLIPRGLHADERQLCTDDPHFYLKATAWNLSTSGVWDDRSGVVSHFTGRIGSNCKFTWWVERLSGAIFGFLVTTARATLVLAVKENGCFKTLRKEGDPNFYEHAEATMSQRTKLMLAKFSHQADIVLHTNRNWHLLYFWEEGDHSVLREGGYVSARDARTLADAVVPSILAGTTTNVYSVAAATAANRNDNVKTISEQVQGLTEDWNEHIRLHYDRSISVEDSNHGPIWLEGYTRNEVTFGFLDYMTHAMLTGKKSFVSSQNRVELPSKWSVVQEIRRVAANTRPDVKILAEDLYGSKTQDTSEQSLDTEDVARFMISGGLSSCFEALNELLLFLMRTAIKKGGWATVINSRDGVLQVVFFNASGDARVARRRTSATDFQAIGLVRPADTNLVEGISVPLTEDPQEYKSFSFWKHDMQENCTKADLHRQFQKSFRDVGESQSLCLVDMTVTGRYVEKEQVIYDVLEEHVGGARSAEDLMKSKLEPVIPYIYQLVTPDISAHDLSRLESFPPIPQDTESISEKLISVLRDANCERPDLMERARRAITDANELHRDIARMSADISSTEDVQNNGN